MSVTLDLHAWCIPDPTPESLPQILHYCIGREYFLMRWVNGVKGLVRAIAPGV
ncbi:hypothetical protein QUB17_09030 [Microcoleus sp. B5-C4]|uniref:hypothetical protein n=1 Tax=Microcoleus sp. B5-C4 TaxID=2818675 RepID=UPI002FCEFCC6